MKQIILTIDDISIMGGAQRVVTNLANELSKTNNITILSFYKSNDMLPYEIGENVKIDYIYTFGESIHKQKSKIKNLYYKNIHKLIISYAIKKKYKQANTIIANDFMFFPYFKNKNTKYIKILHSSIKKYSKRDKMFDTLITLTNQQAQKWKNHYKNIKVIPNFLPSISNEVANYENKTIISVGRMSNEKGFLRLIDIWKIVNEKFTNALEWKLCIIGGGGGDKNLESNLKEKIKEYKLEDSVILKPFTKNIEEVYLNASIYVMCSYFEGLPMVLIEAASYSLPCIAFDVEAGPRDIIENNKSGFLIKDDDLESFANKLIILMNDKTLRQDMGNNAKIIIKQRFSKEAILKLWEEII